MGVEDCKATKKTNWDKASEEAKAKYAETVAEKLNNLDLPSCLNCTNLH